MPCGLVSLVYVAGASDKKEKNVHGYTGADLRSKSYRLSDAKICESRNTDMGANCETDALVSPFHLTGSLRSARRVTLSLSDTAISVLFAIPVDGSRFIWLFSRLASV